MRPNTLKIGLGEYVLMRDQKNAGPERIKRQTEIKKTDSKRERVTISKINENLYNCLQPSLIMTLILTEHKTHRE